MFTIKANGRFRMARIQHGLSIRGLADKAGVNPTTIHKLEKGLSSPHPNTAYKICDALGVKFDDLFELADKEGA